MFGADKFVKQILLSTILDAFGLPGSNCQTEVFGSGLINDTWLVTCGDEKFILQRINSAIFSEPAAIGENIRQIGDYLKEKNPGYFFVQPLATTEEKEIFRQMKFMQTVECP